MNCWKCGHPVEGYSEKIPFRAVCDHCGSWLHVCKQCRFHEPGRPNECKIPDTPQISDREMANYCEEFSPKPEGDSPSRISEKERQEKARKRFNELF